MKVSLFFLLASFCPVFSGEMPELTKEELASLPKDGGEKYNRLIFSKTPYLLKHATNPVEWYPWGEEAFETAKKQNKPVFLSIGWSACHWCDVFNKESFSRTDVAEILNKNYIAIKVDSQERPDIGSIYMTATNLILQGGGGWPNSLWLTPDKKPFYAGTYFPREDDGQRPGFKTVLTKMHTMFTNERERVEESAESILSIMKEMKTNQKRMTLPFEKLNPEKIISAQISQLKRINQTEQRDPKYLPSSILYTAVHPAIKAAYPKLYEEALQSLTLLSSGSILDVVDGGFHRFSLDGAFQRAHFEKMLSDNALLLTAFSRAYAIEKKEIYKQSSLLVLDFLKRMMALASGGFASSFAPNSEGKEGAYYLFTQAEIDAALKERSNPFSSMFHTTVQGNFQSRDHKDHGMNLLTPAKPLVFDESVRLDLLKLRTLREKKIQPFRDDKILTPWNAMVVIALSEVTKAQISQEKELAVSTLEFLRKNLISDEKISHSLSGGVAQKESYFEDYAWMISAALNVSELQSSPYWRQEAIKWFQRMLADFYDEKTGAVFTTPESQSVLIRETVEMEPGSPSGVALILQALEKLGDAIKNKETVKKKILEFYSHDLENSAWVAGEFLHSFLTSETKISKSTEPAKENAKSDLFKFSVKTAKATAFPVHATMTLHSPGQIRIDFEIEDGWHINSAEPKQEFLIPTAIKVLSNHKISKISYPEGKEISFDFSDTPLLVYEGKQSLNFMVEPQDAKELKLEMKIQACNDNTCMSPASLILSF